MLLISILYLKFESTIIYSKPFSLRFTENIYDCVVYSLFRVLKA